MRLAVVVDTFPRWSERFIARELSELARRGVDFTVFCLKSGELPDSGDADWAGLLERRVILQDKLSARSLAAALIKMPKLRASLYARVPPEIADELNLVDVLRLSSASVLEQHLKDGHYRHVHAHFGGLPSSIAWFAATAAQIPLSFSVHARDLFVEPQLLGQKLFACKRVFTCHERARLHMESEFTKLAGRHAEKVVLMRHGLPLDRFKFRSRAESLTRKKRVYILAAGRFVPKKGFLDLIDAINDPILAGRKIILTLLGDGPARAVLVNRIRALKLARKVIVHCAEGGSALRQLFDDADLFVAPYQEAMDGDVDGVPNVVLEAFATGLPVIGTSVGGLGEVLTEQTGTIVTTRNPRALADGIATFLDFPEQARMKTFAARRLVEEKYNIRNNIDPLLELLAFDARAV